MSNLAPLLPLNQGLPHSYLGPATIDARAPLGLTVRLRDGSTVEATLALAFAYQPTVGDTVLSIGNEDGYYVIGVIDAQAQTKLQFAGDLEISAGGSVRIHAAENVELSGKEVAVRASKLELAARHAVQRYDELRQRVTDLFSLQAGKTHTVVEGSSYKRAKNATLLTKEKVSINGKAIHLG